jgi:hypothetical protein
LIGLTALGTIAGAQMAAANDTDHGPHEGRYNEWAHSEVRHIATDASFRAHNPIKVFMKLNDEDGRHPPKRRDYSRRGVVKGDLQGKARIKQQVEAYLPDYVRFVSTPAWADLVLRVNRTDYSLNFRVVDVDHKDKKYKKARHYSGGRCGIHHRAFYTKIKEKGEAFASYQIKANLKGVDRDWDQITLRSAEDFTYGKDLRATTNCGMRPTHVMPSSGVAELFARAGGGYRNHVAQEIKQEAMGDLSRQLAGRIRAYADQYYHDLAYELNSPHRRLHDTLGMLRFIFRENPHG